MVIEEHSFEINSIFNFILKSGNDCFIDVANDTTIIMEKYTEVFNQKMLFDFIFVDICQNSQKWVEDLVRIREMEDRVNVHTKIIGIQNKKKEKAVSTKSLDTRMMDKIIEKTTKDLNEIIYS